MLVLARSAGLEIPTSDSLVMDSLVMLCTALVATATFAARCGGREGIHGVTREGGRRGSRTGERP